ncbi:MAG: YARHG domain-containing protein [Eubacteriales bacterium]|nr:YARHG domain-containing protein [Eubacteriales bacterium]
MSFKRITALALCAMLIFALVPYAGADGTEDDFYIIPDSNTRLLTAEELWGWQYEAVGYIYNEIFARHGRLFRTGQKYDVYFRQRDWYQPNPNYRYSMLNTVEIANQQLAHQVLQDMRAQKTLNLGGKALPNSASEAGAYSDFLFSAYRLKNGQKLDVYTGPGAHYARASNGRATLSTNGDVRIAGLENNWVLVEYETSGGAMRVGYFSLSQLSGRLQNVKQLEFNYASATVASRCSLTDDPDGRRGALATLEANQTVTVLGVYESSGSQWAYVEAQTAIGLVRGFVPIDCVGIGDAGYDWDDEDNANG